MIKTGQKEKRRRVGIFTAAADIVMRTQEKSFMALAAVSLFSSFGDMPLPLLSLVFLQLAKAQMARYTVAAVSVAYFAFTTFYTAEYIPYISFVMVYIIAHYLLYEEKHRAIWPAVTTFGAAKAYLLTFGYDRIYYLILIAEILLLAVLPVIAENGKNILQNNLPLTDFSHIADSIAALGIVALSLDGIHINGLKLSAAFLLGCAFFYGVKNNVALSLASMGALVVSLCQEKQFIFLAAGYMVIYISSTMLLPKGIKGFAAVIGVSAVTSAVLISRFNSITIITTTAVALFCCYTADKKYHPVQEIITGVSLPDAEKDYLALVGKIEKLNRCFGFIGHTVMDISRLLAKDFVPIQAEDMAAAEVCRKCKNNTLCWQENYSYTQGQFSDYAYRFSKGEKADFDELFLSRCDKSPQIKNAIEASANLALTQKLLDSAAQHNRRILQTQFLSMAEILRQITRQSCSRGTVNATATAETDKLLRTMGYKHSYCMCYQNKNRCVVTTKQELSPPEIFRIKNRLENLYDCTFAVSETEHTAESVITTFCQQTTYKCEYSAKSFSRGTDSGDFCQYFETENTAYIILGDGMGTGCAAAAESRTATEMLKSLLCASVQPQTAIEIVNIALNLKGTGQSCVAVDILGISLDSGETVIYKAGGAESLLIKGGKTKIAYRDSLPIGILRDVKTAKLDFSLANGDCIILSSDGVNIDDKLMHRLSLISGGSVQFMAETAVRNADRTDDATAVAVKLVKV